jgi:tetratricopeptide (TPR) repeat protein
MGDAVPNKSKAQELGRRPPQFSLAAIFVAMTLAAMFAGVFDLDPTFGQAAFVLAATFVLVAAALRILRPPAPSSYLSQLGRVMQAHEHLRRERYDDAIDELVGAERFGEPELKASALNARASAWVLKGEYGRAIADYDEAIRPRPHCLGILYNNRAETRLLAGDIWQAIEDCDLAIQLDPKLPDSYFIRGRAKMCQEAFDKALADFQEAIRMKPKYARAYLEMSAAYAALGDAQQAEENRAKAFDLDPSLAVAVPPVVWGE